MAGRLISRLVLLRHSRFRLLFVATFASGIGNWLAVVALQVDVYDRTQSGWWVGAPVAGSRAWRCTIAAPAFAAPIACSAIARGVVGRAAD